jgi:stage II sporulation protein R
MKKINWIAAILSLVLLAGIMCQTTDYIQAGDLQQEIAGKVLRFHVRANSDSKEDQDLKLKVRDAIGSLMSPKLKHVNGLAECKQIAKDNMKDIVDTARQVITSNGYDYPVEVYLKDVDFPVKTYGEYTFPAGNYDALEVIIGSGSGHNWWCVMYPNMCFTGSVYKVIDKDAKQSLQNTLTNKEYESLVKEKDYKIQFKYLTFLNKYFE